MEPNVNFIVQLQYTKIKCKLNIESIMCNFIPVNFYRSDNKLYC